MIRPWWKRMNFFTKVDFQGASSQSLFRNRDKVTALVQLRCGGREIRTGHREEQLDHHWSQPGGAVGT